MKFIGSKIQIREDFDFLGNSEYRIIKCKVIFGIRICERFLDITSLNDLKRIDWDTHYQMIIEQDRYVLLDIESCMEAIEKLQSFNKKPVYHPILSFS